MDRPADLNERLLNYAARIVQVVQFLPRNLIGKRIGDQLLRSGMAAGANYEEAQAGESRDDFVHKLQIALEEIRESNYWLRLLIKTNTVSSDRLTDLLNESDQLKAILSKAVATTKGKAKSPTPK